MAFTVFGYHIIFQLQIAEAKTEMKQQIHSALYSEVYADLVFGQQQMQNITWLEENEFKWNGEMYDVISKEFSGDSVLIRCMPDNKETLLVNQYLKSGKGDDTGHQPSNCLIRLISSYFLITSLEVPSSIQHRIYKIYKPYSFYILANFVPVSTPPPRAC
jgi:hypothetical protein